MVEQAAAPAAPILPPGWRMVRFGDVVRNVDVYVRDPLSEGIVRYVGLDHLDPASLQIKRWGLVEDGTSFTRRFVRGQVLFGKRRAYQRKVAVAEFDGVCSGDILVFVPLDDKLLPELLPFIVQSDGFFQHALGTSAGSLSPRTKWRDLGAYEFPLPPKDEQRRIAEILWTADECVQSDETSLRSLQGVKSTQVEYFLDRGLGWSEARGFGSRAGWTQDEFGYLSCEQLLREGPRNGISPQVNAQGLGYPTLSIGAVRNGRVVPEGNIKYAPLSTEELARFRLVAGDILIVRGNGNRDLTGRAGIVDAIPQDCFYPDLLIRVGFKQEQIRPHFACIQWNADSCHNRLLRRAKSTNGIWKVNGEDIRQHTLIVPPLSEQDAFLALIELIEAAEERAADRLRRSRTLKSELGNNLLLAGSTIV
jgi:type I restriction enzyme S subunit